MSGNIATADLSSLAEELSATDDFAVLLSAEQAVEIAALIVLALRHPDVDDEAPHATQTGRAFAELLCGQLHPRVAQLVMADLDEGSST